MVNIAIAEHTLNIITNYPELHDQSGWVYNAETTDPEVTEETCGTTGCIAGWATIKHFDLKPTVHVDSYDSRYRRFNYQPPAGYDWESAGVEALGISRELAARLFYMGDESEAVQALTDLVAGIEEEDIVIRIRSGWYGDTDEGVE